MAWKYQRGGVWWIGTRAKGKLIQHSTGESDEAKAEAKLQTLMAMEAAQKANKLNRDMFEALTGAKLDRVALFSALDTWLGEIGNDNTRKNYATFAKQIRSAMPHDPDLTDITHGQVRAFLAGIRKEKRASTANLALKQAKVFFGRFKGALQKDPTEDIPAYKEERAEREDFTPEQIRKVMAIAPAFWRCASALSFYTGLRLSNVALLKVGQLEGEKVVVSRTVKTGKKVCVKIPASIMAMIREGILPNADSEDYVWPDEAKHAKNNAVTNLSDQFATLLKNAGLRKDTASAGNGKTGRRNTYKLSFHSLRHSLVSALANSGVNQQVVKQIAGHSSTRVNDAYTHIGQDALDRAVALLPDITKEVAK
jgi:integrase